MKACTALQFLLSTFSVIKSRQESKWYKSDLFNNSLYENNGYSSLKQHFKTFWSNRDAKHAMRILEQSEL